ncbi:transcriptional regulator, AraC family [Loktanella fryxellensis]|uniref:Transcriptional regulator, AraC family n=1 Tax=Loktanella fryxellensis TaxID=245187 RepID=A0A1H8IFW9_9RHOB|nr:AraC family transcriptional regulator [Loktanella fryxellensis]SEN66568.1 transcriptional regulator, AraC family [Loktanella fryxellensis]
MTTSQRHRIADLQIARHQIGGSVRAVTSASQTPLSLQALGQTVQHNRWRTEAMRSHATPRLIAFVRGQGRITVSGLTSGYGPNNLIFVPAGTMYGFELGPTVFGQMLALPAAMAAEWPDTPVHLRLRDVAAQKELQSLLEGLERELTSTRPHHLRAAHYHAGLLSVFVARQIAAQPVDAVRDRADTSAARLVAAFTGLVAQGFRTDPGVADYAAALGVTPTHLTRCCRQTCGRSALALLTDRRHYEACVMLRDTAIPVQQIAADTGFHSAAYFSRAFQARAGTSPSAFRRTGTGVPVRR